jgi:hypothetical protein
MGLKLELVKFRMMWAYFMRQKGGGGWVDTNIS